MAQSEIEQDETTDSDTRATEQQKTVSARNVHLVPIPTKGFSSSPRTETSSFSRQRIIQVAVSFSPVPSSVSKTGTAEEERISEPSREDFESRVLPFCWFKPSAGAVSRHGLLPSLAVPTGALAGEEVAVGHRERSYDREEDEQGDDQERALSSPRETGQRKSEQGRVRENSNKARGRRKESGGKVTLFSPTEDRGYESKKEDTFQASLRQGSTILTWRGPGGQGANQAGVHEGKERAAYTGDVVEENSEGEEERLLARCGGWFPEESVEHVDTTEEGKEKKQEARHLLEQGHSYRPDHLWIASQFIDDTARVYRTIAGPDPADPLTLWYAQLRNASTLSGDMRDTPDPSPDTGVPCEAPTAIKENVASSPSCYTLEAREAYQPQHGGSDQAGALRERCGSPGLRGKDLPSTDGKLTSQGGGKARGHFRTNCPTFRAAHAVLRDRVRESGDTIGKRMKSLAVLTLPFSSSRARRRDSDDVTPNNSVHSLRGGDHGAPRQSRQTTEDGALEEMKEWFPSGEGYSYMVRGFSHRASTVHVHPYVQRECTGSLPTAHGGGTVELPVVEISIAQEALEGVRSAAEVLAACEAVTNLARFDGMTE